MARIYGRNSGYLKKKDLKHYAISGIIPIVLLILIWAIFKNYKQLGDWGFVFVIFILVIIAKALEPIIRRHRKRSNQYYRGRMGEYKVEDESLNLSDNYSVFRNVIINPERGNIDYVIVGPGGVYTLEVKSHSGKIDFDGEKLTLNGKPFEKDFLKQAKSEALQVHNFIKEKTSLDIFVKPILIFSGYASMRFGLRPIDGVYVIGRSFLHEFFDKEPVADFSRSKIEEALKEL